MPPDDESLPQSLQRWLGEAGVDLNRVELLPYVPHDELSTIYGNTDVGLFPNRCEGGTNLVMMEYMACGRPVVATDYGGHADVVTDANSVRLRHWRLQPIFRDGEAIAFWSEPDIEEVVEGLERVYNDRKLRVRLGQQAARELSAWTWTRMAQDLLPLLE
jgi:glycosyltransferase involved in cell wall biosynthesis